VRLPDAVSRIDAYGFANSSVRIVNIPTGLSSMGNASFQNCQQLDSLTIAEGTTWGDAWDTWKNCKALTDVENGYMRFHSGFGIRYNGLIGDTLLNVPSYIHALGCYCYYYATDNPRTFVATQDTMFTANWQIRRFTVTLTPSEHGIIYTGGTFDYGTYVPLVAEADEHYRFDRWSDGSTDNPYTIFLDRDTVLSAVFLPLDYTISAAQAIVGGEVTGYGTYPYATEVVLTAVPAEGYIFKQWSDGPTDNPRTVVMTDNYILDPVFEQLSGFENTSAEKARKVMIDGQVYILRGGKTYNVFGTEM